MVANELARQAMNLPVADRLDLARQLVESVVTPESMTDTVKAGIQRIEDVATGRVVGLTEAQFRAALISSLHSLRHY